jgi:hypothetical protein
VPETGEAEKGIHGEKPNHPEKEYALADVQVFQTEFFQLDQDAEEGQDEKPAGLAEEAGAPEPEDAGRADLVSAAALPSGLAAEVDTAAHAAAEITTARGAAG